MHRIVVPSDNIVQVSLVRKRQVLYFHHYSYVLNDVIVMRTPQSKQRVKALGKLCRETVLKCYTF